MTCPTPIAEVLLDIMRQGLLLCRAAGWAGNADQCAREADHLHNLPSLLADYSPEKLAFYWEVERPSFAARCERDQLLRWELQWQRLRPFVEEAKETVTTT
jgi:hypothetical protein